MTLTRPGWDPLGWVSTVAQLDPSLCDEAREIQRVAEHAALELAQRHAGRLQCARGCHRCCVDGIEVLEVEAALIVLHHAGLLMAGRPHPSGACAFLDARGACRVHARRPLVCRSEGLPLRWCATDEDGSPTEHRDICPLNDRGPALLDLAPADCWLVGPFEGRMAEIQRRCGRPDRRIALRSLFVHRS